MISLIPTCSVVPGEEGFDEEDVDRDLGLEIHGGLVAAEDLDPGGREDHVAAPLDEAKGPSPVDNDAQFYWLGSIGKGIFNWLSSMLFV